MASKSAIILVILAVARPSRQDTSDNTVDDPNPFAEIAATLLKNQNAENIGSLVSHFLQSGGGQQLGNIISNAVTKNGAASAQVLAGLASLMTQTKEGKGGVDPSVVGSVLSMLGSEGKKQEGGFDAGDLLALAGNFLQQPQQKDKPRSEEASGFDPGDLLSLAASFFSQPGNAETFASYVPMVLQTLGSFAGPEAEERAKSHSGHAWRVPPVLENIHVFLDQFMHSEMGRNLVNALGAEKFVRIFSDENGKFSFLKFVEMLENQSFRRHWIQLVTSRIGDVVTFASNPKMQKKYFASIQFFINTFLKNNGFPKSAMFDPIRPTESLTGLVNYASKKYLDHKVDSREYVQPIVEYVQELFRMAQTKGFLIGSGVDSREFSHKLTDTINLEIIEPIARVNRGFRFARKVPECEKYVMCLVNQEDPNEQLSLPGLKSLLSKGSSIVARYFLGSITDTSFSSLFNSANEENDCKIYYTDACHDFHIEEIKVTTEYVHNEL